MPGANAQRDGSDHGGATDARSQFALASRYLTRGTGRDRDLALTRLALAEVELGGDGNDLANEVCEKWDDVQRLDLQAALFRHQRNPGPCPGSAPVCARLIALKNEDGLGPWPCTAIERTGRR